MNELVFDPEMLTKKLLEHGVDFVVIGGVAATLHGSPVVTTDLDIAYERTADNLDRLAAALQEINARLRGVEEHLPFVPDARTLKSGSNFAFSTDLGDLDCLGWAAGRTSYDELRRGAVEMRLGRHTILAASIDDLIAMKEAAGRDKDQYGVMHLRAVKQATAHRGTR
jgi:hypothetical protein